MPAVQFREIGRPCGKLLTVNQSGWICKNFTFLCCLSNNSKGLFHDDEPPILLLEYVSLYVLVFLFLSIVFVADLGWP